jgi:hypothetical protein
LIFALSYIYWIGSIPYFFDRKAELYDTKIPAAHAGYTWYACPVINGAIALPPNWLMRVSWNKKRCDLLPTSWLLRILGIRASYTLKSAPAPASEHVKESWVEAAGIINSEMETTWPFDGPLHGMQSVGPLCSLPWMNSAFALAGDMKTDRVIVFRAQAPGEWDNSFWNWTELSHAIIGENPT